VKRIRIILVKSPNGCKSSHRATVKGLGLKRINQEVELVDTPEVRGMIERVNYLVRVEG
jgi:large subunit ribosomal protein L30